MFHNDDIQTSLVSLGGRVRAARIARGDDQLSFARRLGVSVPTLRSLEKGEGTVAIGTLAASLWMLSRLPELDRLLEVRESLFDRLERRPKTRQRVSPKARAA